MGLSLRSKSRTYLLRQEVNPDGVFIWVGPQLDLCHHLVREGVAHHEAGMAHGTAQVDQPAFSQQDDAAPVLQPVAVHLQVPVATVRDGGYFPPLPTPYPAQDGLKCPQTTTLQS